MNRRGPAAVDRLLIGACLRAPGWAFLLATGMCATTAAGLLAPAALGSVTNAVMAHRDAAAATAGLAAILAAGAVGAAATGFAGPAVLSRNTAWLGRRLFEHAVSLGLDGQRKFPPGDMTTRLLDNTNAAAGVALSAAEIAMNLLTSLGAFVALWLANWTLGVAFLVAAVPAAVLARSSMRGMSGAFLTYSRAQGQLAARLGEALHGIRTIQSSGTAALEVDRILRPLPEMAAAGAATWAARQRLAWRSALSFALAELIVLATAGWQVAVGRLSPGGWLAAAGYATLALGLLGISDDFSEILHARAAAIRLTEVLDTKVPASAAGTARLGESAGAVTFRDVTVRSGDRIILDHLDLDVPAGVTAAIVGRSGAGKTTLMALLCRLAEPDEGTVFLDGLPVSSFTPPELRHRVGYAFARPARLGKTVADEIGYGTEVVAQADIEQAARMARADGFIRRLPGGYRTPMADAPLSGGERQRLGIARALVQGARVLVLDDATSSLDTATANEVTQALRGLRTARTKFVITHRAATAAQADLVIWLDQGRVRGLAAHGQLWRDPAYRSLFRDAPLEEAI